MRKPWAAPAMLLMLPVVGYSLEAKIEPFLSFKWSGGLSPYSEIAIAIEESGHAHVRAEGRKSNVTEYDTDLTSDELEALRTLIRSTDFFSQPDKDSQFATDVGQTELTISQEGRTKKLTFRYRPELDPLRAFLEQLHVQAQAFRSLADGDIYPVLTALASNYAGIKALQPQRLKEPLMTYLTKETDNQRIQWGLEALATVTTPEEFAGFIARQQRIGKKTYLPAPYNFPEKHRLALCPLYLAFLKDKYPHLSLFEKEANGDAEQIVRVLGDLRYQPAIPFFMQWFEENEKPDVIFGLVPIAEMGIAGIRTLAAQLDSPNAPHRQSAMELLMIAARSNPHNAYPNPISDWEYSQMKELFTNMVFPKLARLAASDSSETIRKKATSTMQKIKTEMNKGAAAKP